MRRLALLAAHLLTVFASSLAGPQLAEAQGGAIGNAVAIERGAKLLGDVGDAIGRITDGVEKMIKAGDKAWSVIQARQTHGDLVDLSRELEMELNTNTLAIDALDRYVHSPSKEKWAAAMSHVRGGITRADAILSRLDKERSDLVLHPAYDRLEAVLHARRPILEELADAVPSNSARDQAALKRLIAQYRALRGKLRAARAALNAYIRTASQEPSSQNESGVVDRIAALHLFGTVSRSRPAGYCLRAHSPGRVGPLELLVSPCYGRTQQPVALPRGSRA